jgi:hypothetical protein
MFDSLLSPCDRDVLTRKPAREDIHARGVGEFFDVLEDRDVGPVSREDATTIRIAFTHPRDTAAGHGLHGEVQAADPGEQRSDRQPHGINPPASTRIGVAS